MDTTEGVTHFNVDLWTFGLDYYSINIYSCSYIKGENHL